MIASPDFPPLAVAVLAGGAGRRIGGGKPLQPFGGERLIDRAVRRASQWSGLVAIGAKSRDQVLRDDVALVPDASIPGLHGPLDGPLAGLAGCLAWACRHDCDLLTVPVDMPFLPDDLAARLRHALRGRSGPAAAVAASDGRLHPVCALWRGPLEAVLLQEVRSGRTSLNNLARRVGASTVDWTGAPDPFCNVNTPHELATAQRRIARCA